MANPFSKHSLGSSHSEFLLAQLNEFRKNEQFTDVILDCNGVRQAAHRNILSAASDYFAAMFCGNFSENNQQIISFDELDSHCMELVLDYIYTGQLKISEDYVQDLLVTGSFLQLHHVENRCAQFMSGQLDINNCLEFKRFAEKHSNMKLQEAAMDHIIVHFQDIIKGEEFLEMTYMELTSMLSNDQFYLLSDDNVVRGLVRWAEHKPIERISELGSLVCYINPTYVSSQIANSLPMLEKEPRGRKWIQDVIQSNANMGWRIFVLTRQCLNSYDLNFNSKQQLNVPSVEGVGFTLTAHRNILYMQGGRTLNPRHPTSGYYDICKNRWYDLKQVTVPRIMHRSVVLQDNLYSLGGCAVDGVIGSVECLELATNKSYFRESMHDKRILMGAVACEQAIYALGGATFESLLYSAERYDPREGRWQRLPDLQREYGCSYAAYVNGSIYTCDTNGYLDRLDLRTNRWEFIGTNIQGECYGMFAAEQQLYTINPRSISRFDVKNRNWLPSFQLLGIPIWECMLGLQMVSSFTTFG